MKMVVFVCLQVSDEEVGEYSPAYNDQREREIVKPVPHFSEIAKPTQAISSYLTPTRIKTSGLAHLSPFENPNPNTYNITYI